MLLNVEVGVNKILAGFANFCHVSCWPSARPSCCTLNPGAFLQSDCGPGPLRKTRAGNQHVETKALGLNSCENEKDWDEAIYSLFFAVREFWGFFLPIVNLFNQIQRNYIQALKRFLQRRRENHDVLQPSTALCLQ